MFCGIYELNFFWWLVYNNEFKMFVFEGNKSEVDLIYVIIFKWLKYCLYCMIWFEKLLYWLVKNMLIYLVIIYEYIFVYN